jgi:hypothetical protein
MNKRNTPYYSGKLRVIIEITSELRQLIIVAMAVSYLLILSGCSENPCVVPTVDIPSDYMSPVDPLPEPGDSARNPKDLADYTMTVIQHDGELQVRLRNLQSFLRKLEFTLHTY